MTHHRPARQPVAARLDTTTDTLKVHHLQVRDPVVADEARRWAADNRGEIADDTLIAAADLAPFVEHAIVLGARALAGARRYFVS